MSGILGIRGVGWYPGCDVVVKVETDVEVETVVVDVDVEADKVVELSLSTLTIWKEWLVVVTYPPLDGIIVCWNILILDIEVLIQDRTVLFI